MRVSPAYSRIRVRDGTYTGTLDNDPDPGKGLPAHGDQVTFQGKHIITVMPSRDKAL